MQRKQLKDDLIILKRFTINENDILVNAFGRFSGKIQLKAKGSKKILSKFTGRLEPLSIISAEIYDSGKSYTLTTANLKFCPIQESNYQAFELSQKICGILNRFLPFEEPNAKIFHLIERIAEQYTSTQNINKTEIFFLTKFLEFSGFLPSFSFCNNCHEKFEQNPFANSELIFTCAKCLPNTPEANLEFQEINLNTLKLLNYITNCKKPEDLRSIKIPDSNNEQARLILNRLTNHLSS
jgi:DNA repair protein RecO